MKILLTKDIHDIREILLIRKTSLRLANGNTKTPKGLKESRLKHIERIDELITKLSFLEDYIYDKTIQK